MPFSWREPRALSAGGAASMMRDPRQPCLDVQSPLLGVELRSDERR